VTQVRPQDQHRLGGGDALGELGESGLETVAPVARLELRVRA
jgi:hypothetical protein